MKYRVVITRRALSDLRPIRDYIAADSPDNAAEFLDRVAARRARIFGTVPAGVWYRPRNDLVPYELRQLVHKPYRVLYRVTGKDVEILHVRHGARMRASPVELGS